MSRVHDLLDYDRITVTSKDGTSITGMPISVLYADENMVKKEDLIDIEDDNGNIYGFYENEIQKVVIIA